MEENLLLDNDILELEGIDYARENIWLTYKDEDMKPVPRVTKIIGQNRDSDFLIQWAANIGRRKYDYFREKALNIGTIVHANIDFYLEDKYINKTNTFSVDYSEMDPDYRESVFNCIENFKLWDANLAKHNAAIEEIIGLEVPVVCPWYGGTVDGIIKINGAVYIVDFKTSKQISNEYLIQASAYMWMINNGYAPNLPHIDGIGIIRVDKRKRGAFNDLFLNNFDAAQHVIIENYQRCFAAYVNSYYRTISTDFITDNYNKLYNPSEVFSNAK